MNNKILYSLLLVLFTFSCSNDYSPLPNGKAHFWLPNSFTPNGDGLNDSFNPIPMSSCFFNEYHIIIFDENTHILFESTDINEYWDPVAQGQNLPIGAYDYQIMYSVSEDSIQFNNYIANYQVYLLR